MVPCAEPGHWIIIVATNLPLKSFPDLAAKLVGGGGYDISNVVYPSVINQAMSCLFGGID